MSVIQIFIVVIGVVALITATAGAGIMSFALYKGIVIDSYDIRKSIPLVFKLLGVCFVCSSSVVFYLVSLF